MSVSLTVYRMAVYSSASSGRPSVSCQLACPRRPLFVCPTTTLPDCTLRCAHWWACCWSLSVVSRRRTTRLRPTRGCPTPCTYRLAKRMPRWYYRPWTLNRPFRLSCVSCIAWTTRPFRGRASLLAPARLDLHYGVDGGGWGKRRWAAASGAQCTGRWTGGDVAHGVASAVRHGGVCAAGGRWQYRATRDVAAPAGGAHWVVAGRRRPGYFWEHGGGGELAVRGRRRQAERADAVSSGAHWPAGWCAPRSS